MVTIEIHLVSVVRLQVRDSDLILVSPNTHDLGLSIFVLVLDSEGVKVSLGDGPGQLQGILGGLCHCQLPKLGLLCGLRSLSGWHCGHRGLFYFVWGWEG